MKRNHLDIFSPLVGFPIVYALWYGYGISQLGGVGGTVTPMVTAGLLAYVFGCFLLKHIIYIRTPITIRYRPVKLDCLRWRNYTLLIAQLACAGISYLLIVSAIGIPLGQADFAFRRLAISKHSKEYFVFNMSSWWVITYVSSRMWSEHWSGARRVLSWLVILGVLGLTATLGNRGPLLMIFVVLIVCRHYLLRPVTLWRLAGALALGVGFFGVYGAARDLTAKSGPGFFESFGTWAVIYGLNYVVQSVQALIDIVHVIPTNVPFQGGWLSFGAIAQLLPGHHETNDMFFRKILHSEFVGFGQPATLLGPMYADFGVPGVMVEMFLLGLIYTWAYAWLSLRPSRMRVIVYAWVTQSVLLGIFGGVFTYVHTLLFPLLIVVGENFVTGGAGYVSGLKGAKGMRRRMGSSVVGLPASEAGRLGRALGV
jgi:oligosaccharide repeat unit polymerase